MGNVIKEIVKNYYRQDLEVVTPTHVEMVKDEAILAPKSYKQGQYKTFEHNGFSMEKAIAKAGIAEAKPTHFFKGGRFDKGTLGISEVKPETVGSVFAINPKAKVWPQVVFHEAGHCVLGHTVAIPDLETRIHLMLKGVTPDQWFAFDTAVKEMEANLFNYFCCKAINYDGDFALLAAGVRHFENEFFQGSFPQKYIDRVKEKAGEFIANGRA